ncbi:UvrD-helicase domain-containing protein [Gynurincola endophyticus]|uniref:UvrD-helicase domain-containing protein n=1 Tax=Gynurincola endophyticus TaxID=2479004 RepID=UPI000F8F449E|nr:UvrD-helicase domain-containing protein [Gynurincola endophyticus]
MELSAEQKKIIETNESIKINAVAGSGKTTTLIAYAASRPSNARILYIAYNKSVRLEAKRKFEAAGLHHVVIETAHSLAYKNIVFQHRYEIKASGYKVSEIAQLLSLKNTGDKHSAYIIANHILKFVQLFCNSQVFKVQELDYLSTLEEESSIQFVQTHFPYILQQTRLFLARMDRNEIPVTHDFYLKKFQLSRPVLNFDYILFDEAQDASACMLDILKYQFAKIVMVGDTHQQIYSWRNAVNSLQKVNYPTFHLSNSFRFNEALAQLAFKVLNRKKHFDETHFCKISGKGKHKVIKTRAVIARTNLGLLTMAIEVMKKNPLLKKIHFEGQLNSYTYAEDGASLYDVLNLQNGKKEHIRDIVIKEMNSIDDLEKYIEDTEDVQLGIMVEIVKEYGNDIFTLLKDLKELHTDDKTGAEWIFSTVHKSKGMEYDHVILTNDFLTEKAIKDMVEESDRPINLEVKLGEEINLLYVAITRAKVLLEVPENLTPVEFEANASIKIIQTKSKNSSTSSAPAQKIKKVFSQPKHNSSQQKWTTELDAELRKRYFKGDSIADLSHLFGRTKASIWLRIKKLGIDLE